MYYVASSADPDAAVGFEDALAGLQPFAIEFVICFGALRFVPRAFIDADHFSGVASDASVGKEIGWVGEDEVNGFGGHGVENFAAIALKNFDMVFAVVEGGGHYFSAAEPQRIALRRQRRLLDEGMRFRSRRRLRAGRFVDCFGGGGHFGVSGIDQVGSLIEWLWVSSQRQRQRLLTQRRREKI